MTATVLVVVAVAVLLIAVGVGLALLVVRFGHRHEEQVFAVMADLRQHSAETEIRERQALNQLAENLQFVRGLAQAEVHGAEDEAP